MRTERGNVSARETTPENAAIKPAIRIRSATPEWQKNKPTKSFETAECKRSGRWYIEPALPKRTFRSQRPTLPSFGAVETLWNYVD